MSRVYLDIEATGTDPLTDRMFEISLQSPAAPEFTTWVNPERPIPKEVVDLCKLTADDLAEIASAQPFAGVLQEIATRLMAADTWVGFGVHQFDLPLLAEEFERVGMDLPWRGK